MITIEMQEVQFNKIIKGLEKVHDKLVEFKKFKQTQFVIMQNNKIVLVKP
jgi:hypothetical protein